MAFLAAGEGRRLFGVTTPSELPNKWAMCRAPAGRRLRLHHAVELPDGDPGVEVHGGARLRQHVVIKPATDTPAVRASTLAQACSRRRAFRAGVVNVVTGAGAEVGDPLVAAPATSGSSRSPARPRSAEAIGEACAPHVQARPPRDGRQERDPRHGRRGPRPGGRRRALGRVRHDGPALHGVVAAARAQGRLRRVRRQARRARRRRCASATASTDRRGHGAVRLRVAARDGVEVRRDRQRRKARGSSRAARS